MSKKVFKIWDHSRSIKKCFVSEVDLLAVTKKANDLGIIGTNLVLEEDGTEVNEAETLAYFAGKTFLLLGNNEKWTPALILTAENSQCENLMSPVTIQPCDFIDLYTPKFPNSSLDDTLSEDSISSGMLSSSSEEGKIGISQSKILFASYKIKWNKLPQNILQIFEKQYKIDKYLNDFVHFIVDDMRSISFYIPTTIFRRVAQDALLKYPKSLGLDCEKDDVNVDPENLTAKFVYHNNYLNRKNGKRSSDENMKPSTIKKLNSLKESCPNWLGECDEDEDSLERKRIFLRENFCVSNFKSTEKETINKYFDETFSIQSKFLNNIDKPPTVLQIQQEWPHLLDPFFAKRHFYILMSNNEIKLQNLEKHIDLINAKGKDLDFCQCKYRKMLLVLTNYYKEDIAHIVEFFDIGTCVASVIPKHNLPWIAAIKTNLEATVFYIFIEKTQCTAMTTLAEALEMLIMYFFNFNMCYPKEASLTFQTLQHLIGISNTFGRSTKKTLGNKSKVHTFLHSISHKV